MKCKAKIEIFGCDDSPLIREVHISSSLTEKYPEHVELNISSREDLSVIQAASASLSPVRVRYGIYESWVNSVASYSSGMFDEARLIASPFYRTGQQITRLVETVTGPMEVPPNGGNVDGIIKELVYSPIGVVGITGLWVLYDCGLVLPSSFVIDSEQTFNGVTTPDAGSYGGSFKQHNLNFLSSQTALSLGDFALTNSQSLLITEPRHLVYGVRPPLTSSESVLLKLNSPTQTESTTYHNRANSPPFAYTFSFRNPSVIRLTARGGNIAYPANLLYRLDYMAFLPTVGVSVRSYPFGFGSSGVTFTRDESGKLVARSNGKAYESFGEVKFSSRSTTTMHVVGGNSTFGSVPRVNANISLVTYRGFRLPLHRLP